MFETTTPETNPEIRERRPLEVDADDCPSLSEDRMIHLLLTAWTEVLEEERTRRDG